jgi:hypothetical protein
MHAIAIEAAFTFLLLAHPCYSVRERITPPPHVAVLGVCHPDMEIRHRCHGGAERVRIAAIARLIEAQRPTPWIDALPPDWPNRNEIMAGYLATAQAMRPDDHAGDWPNWRYAMELYLFSLSVEQARAVLALAPRGQYWTAHQGWIVPKPVEAAPQPTEEP